LKVVSNLAGSSAGNIPRFTSSITKSNFCCSVFKRG